MLKGVFLQILEGPFLACIDRSSVYEGLLLFLIFSVACSVLYLNFKVYTQLMRKARWLNNIRSRFSVYLLEAR